MASPPSVRVRLKSLAENPKASVKVRVWALEELSKLGVPMALLQRLMKDRSLNPRLLAKVVELVTALRKHRRSQKAGYSRVLGSIPSE